MKRGFGPECAKRSLPTPRAKRLLAIEAARKALPEDDVRLVVAERVEDRLLAGKRLSKRHEAFVGHLAEVAA